MLATTCSCSLSMLLAGMSIVVRYLMEGSLQSLLGLGTTATNRLVGGFSSTPCACLKDGNTRSWMNTLARTSARVDPNFDNSLAAWLSA
jgi:hypothetical protein